MTDELAVYCADGHDRAEVTELWRHAGVWVGGRVAMSRAAFAEYCDKLAAGLTPARVKIACDCGYDVTVDLARIAPALDRVADAGMAEISLASLGTINLRL